MWLSVVKTFTTCSEWPTGNGRNSNALMMPKTVVFAPIPRTKARNATIEKARYLTSIRKAKRRSFIIMVTPFVGLELDQHLRPAALGLNKQATPPRPEQLPL